MIDIPIPERTFSLFLWSESWIINSSQSVILLTLAGEMILVKKDLITTGAIEDLAKFSESKPTNDRT